jgi:hypothetical protein
MKVAAVVFIAVFILSSQAALAHPPSDIMITFDRQTKVMQAVITHNTSNAANHFISKVDVAINGKEVIEHKISRQDNNETQTVQYLIPDVLDGDIISVEGYCSISGKLETKITVKSENP